MPQKSDWMTLAEQMQQELANDAPILAKDLYSDQWDGHTMSDAEAEQMIHAAYLRQDRAYLSKLAMQGPEQFLRVIKKIGVVYPPIEHGVQPDVQPVTMPAIGPPQPQQPQLQPQQPPQPQQQMPGMGP